MIFENKIGQEFNNMAQRVIYPYIFTYPDFIPVKSNEVTDEAQRQVYEYLKNTLIKIYNHPDIIGMSVGKDDISNGETLKKQEKIFLGFFNLLYELGLNAVLENDKFLINKSGLTINKNKIIMLSQLGLDCTKIDGNTFIYSNDYPDLFLGLKFLSRTCYCAAGREIKNAVVSQSIIRLLFMKCIFDKEYVSFDYLYGDLLQSGKYLSEIEQFLKEKDYKYSFFDAGFYLIKNYADKQQGQFLVRFDWRSKDQLSYNIKIPDFSSLVTRYYYEADYELKEFIFSRTGVCRSCGYCTQTDKIGKRKPMTTCLDFNGEIIDKCPLFPNTSWKYLDDKSVSIIKKVIDFSENIIYNK